MRPHALLISEAVVVLAACSHTSNPDATAAPSLPASPPASAPSTAASATALEATASEHPFEDYRAPGDDAVAWVALYYAASGAPVDYTTLAARLDPAYQKTTDAFKQRDALTALKARLEPAIAAAKASPYVQLPPVRMHRPAYDVAQNSYNLTPLIGPQHRFTVADGNARVALKANPRLVAYTPTDEAEARALEQAMSANPLAQVDVIIYGKAVAAAAIGGTPQIALVPTRVVVENAFVNGTVEPLFTATANP